MKVSNLQARAHLQICEINFFEQDKKKRAATFVEFSLKIAKRYLKNFMDIFDTFLEEKYAARLNFDQI